VCGTIPDLDVLVRFSDPVASFTYHRSFSHSLIVLALLTPLMVWLIRKIHPADARHRLGWYGLVYLAFATHVLLDSFTIYGTQIFWPLYTVPMTWGSVFIIDPLYTLPLILGVAAAALLRNNPGLGYRINAAMLALSTLYLGWSMVVKLHVQDLARSALAEQGIEYRQILTLAGPFNTVLWRLVAMDEAGYYTGWYSLLDKDATIEFEHHISEPGLLNGIESHWPVARLRWFTKGFYRVTQERGEVLITDLRMGLEDAYVFRFKVAEVGNPHALPTPSENRGQSLDFSRLPALWNRIKGNREAWIRSKHE